MLKRKWTEDSGHTDSDEDEDINAESKVELPIKRKPACESADEDEQGVGDRSPADKEGSAEDGQEDDEDLGEDEATDVPEETVINEAESDSDYSDTDEAKPSSTVLDPYRIHFEREMAPQQQQLLESLACPKARHQINWVSLENLLLTVPTDEVFTISEDHKSSLTLLEQRQPTFIQKPSLPSALSPSSKNQNDKAEDILQSLFIKSKIRSNIINANTICTEKSSTPGPLTPMQTELLTLMGNYHDIYIPHRTFSNEHELRNAYCFHVANHITKVRSRILHHNSRLANKTEVPEEFRDQGFVRPKVLILVPFKESALRVVKVLISTFLSEEKGNVQNKRRFVNDFSGETLFMPKTNPKPEDYMATFAGNVEDNFKIGLCITKKSIKLFTGFYSSDIIIASPLGLRLIVGAEGEKNRDYDFLSSIEVLIMDQADVFLVQSWDHVLHLMKHMHLQPVTTHGTDFGRIRPWAVEGQSKFYCQTIMLSSMMCPEHNALLSRYCKNYAGLAKLIPPLSKGAIMQITSPLPQVFHQFAAESVAESIDARFNYFVEKILPDFTGGLMSHTLIFVSSYFDFVRLRNYFKREEKSFVQICEYTKDKKIARARDLFFHNQSHFLVYTERAHFFRRFRLKGIGHIIFYQLPQYPHFYPELCNLIHSQNQNRRVRQRNNSSVNVIYCKYDAPRLAGIVGNERANHMLTSAKKIHAIVSAS